MAATVTWSQASLDDIDEADGQKIVSHVFGSNADQVAQTLTNEKGTAGIDFGKLLPILAPIVIGTLVMQGIGDLSAQVAAADAATRAQLLDGFAARIHAPSLG